MPRYKKSSYRRKRIYRKRSFKRRNPMQKKVLAGICMKYTKLFVPSWAQGESQTSATISLCGGRGPQAATGYITLADCDPDLKATTDMKTFTQASIYGVSCKWIFAEPTTPDASPVAIQMAYSPNEIMNPLLMPETMQGLSTYQAMPCNQNRSVQRYFPLGITKSKLGIDYFDTSEYPLFNAESVLYNGQLDGGNGPSLHYKIDRNTGGA